MFAKLSRPAWTMTALPSASNRSLTEKRSVSNCSSAVPSAFTSRLGMSPACSPCGTSPGLKCPPADVNGGTHSPTAWTWKPWNSGVTPHTSALTSTFPCRSWKTTIPNFSPVASFNAANARRPKPSSSPVASAAPIPVARATDATAAIAASLQARLMKNPPSRILGVFPLAPRRKTSLDRGDRIALFGPGPLARGVRREALDELGPEVTRLDHRVDDQLRGQVQDVDLLGVLRAQLLGPARSFVGVADRLQLVVEDRVDRRLRTHHGDLRVRQGEAGVGLVARPRHGVEPGAVGLPHDHRDLRDRRLRDCRDHLRPGPDDPLTFDLGADHEAGDVREEEQGDVERVAGPDEARGLVGRVDEQDTASLLRLVRDDPDRAPVDARVADDQLPGPALLDLEERARIDQRADQVEHVERLVLVGRDLGELAPGLHRRRRGRLLAPVLREIREVALREVDPLLVGHHEEVATAGHARVHARSAHLLEGDPLADHHLGHPR